MLRSVAAAELLLRPRRLYPAPRSSLFDSQPRRGFSQSDAGLLGNLTMRLGETVERDTAPPPISGGTLLVLRDGDTFVAADLTATPSGSSHLRTQAVRSVALPRATSPARVEEGDDGTVYALPRRGGAAVVTIDLGHRVHHRAARGVPRPAASPGTPRATSSSSPARAVNSRRSRRPGSRVSPPSTTTCATW
ncbi:MAG: hypothetical protein R3A48_23885 [Polyangiales bacterium]